MHLSISKRSGATFTGQHSFSSEKEIIKFKQGYNSSVNWGKGVYSYYTSYLARSIKIFD